MPFLAPWCSSASFWLSQGQFLEQTFTERWSRPGPWLVMLVRDRKVSPRSRVGKRSHEQGASGAGDRNTSTPPRPLGQRKGSQDTWKPNHSPLCKTWPWNGTQLTQGAFGRRKRACTPFRKGNTYPAWEDSLQRPFAAAEVLHFPRGCSGEGGEPTHIWHRGQPPGRMSRCQKPHISQVWTSGCHSGGGCWSLQTHTWC